MINAILIIAAVALFAYDPAVRLFAKWQKSRKATRESILPESPREPTRLEAFKAAETLVAYFDSIGHDAAAESANNTAQWLFTNPGDK